MPTLRLGDSERQQIRIAFSNAMARGLNNKAFPLSEDDFPEFGYSLLTPAIADAYSYLHEHAHQLVRSSSYRPDFKIADEVYRYGVNIRGVSMPMDGMEVPRSHPRYDEILDWTATYGDIQEKIVEAKSTVQEIVRASSSAGQIKRVMQEDILRFLPWHMQDSFNDAERRSRWPSGLQKTGMTQKLDQLGQMLALGAISPEQQPGIQATVDYRKPTNSKAT